MIGLYFPSSEAAASNSLAFSLTTLKEYGAYLSYTFPTPVVMNLYKENPALKFQLGHPLMEKIVALKEQNFADKDKYDYAPQDFEDAIDSYDRILEIVGEICGDIIAPNAESVDHEGPQVINNRVKYARGTQILHWIEQHNFSGSYIVIDDDTESIQFYKDLDKRLVATKYYSIFGGFRLKHVIKAIKLFKQQEKII